MALKAVLISQRFFIIQNSIIGTVEAYEDLQFRNPVGVLDTTPGKIDIFSLLKEDIIVEFLPDLEVIEEPTCTYPLAGGRLDNPEVLPDTDVILDMSTFQSFNPFLTYELPVDHKVVNAFGTEKTDEAFRDFLSFIPIGLIVFM